MASVLMSHNTRHICPHVGRRAMCHHHHLIPLREGLWLPRCWCPLKPSAWTLATPCLHQQIHIKFEKHRCRLVYPTTHTTYVPMHAARRAMCHYRDLIPLREGLWLPWCWCPLKSSASTPTIPWPSSTNSHQIWLMSIYVGFKRVRSMKKNTHIFSPHPLVLVRWILIIISTIWSMPIPIHAHLADNRGQLH
jgi:hypothetical protein